MTLAVVTVGRELLAGSVVNTNAAELGRRAAAVGLRVVAALTVPDEVDDIGAAVDVALRRADDVVVTGGLGPTSDDVTSDALLRHADGHPVRRLPNPVGSAPGLRLDLPAGVVYALPGVPREMTAMLEDSVLPDLLARRRDPTTTLTTTLRVVGLREEVAAAALTDVESLAAREAVTLAYLPGLGSLDLRLSATGRDGADARRRLGPVERAARSALGEAVYGAGEDTLAGVTHRLLAARGETVAAAESLTGGLLGAELSSPPGASGSFRGAVVAYATELKAALLGVPESVLAEHGAVSPQTAAAMAAGVRRRLVATYGVALTGVAGPDEQEGHPPGTVHLGLASPRGELARSWQFTGDRDRVRRAAVIAAVDLLRRQLGSVVAAAGLRRGFAEDEHRPR